MLATTWFVSPQEPSVALHVAIQGPERDYQPGGTGCDPNQLNALLPEQGSAERDRCAQAHEDHRVQQAEITQAVRANDLAEGNLRLAAQQARIAFVQTLATVLAFIAAAVAAVFAGLAVYHSKRSADADNAALAETRDTANRQLRPYLSFTTDRQESPAPIPYDGETIVRLRNFGQTPARDIRLNIASEAVTRPVGSPDLSFTAPPVAHWDMSPGEDMEVGLAMSDLTPDQYQQIAAGTRVLVSRLRVDYEYAPGQGDFHEVWFLTTKETLKTGMMRVLTQRERENS